MRYRLNPKISLHKVEHVQRIINCFHYDYVNWSIKNTFCVPMDFLLLFKSLEYSQHAPFDVFGIEKRIYVLCTKQFQPICLMFSYNFDILLNYSWELLLIDYVGLNECVIRCCRIIYFRFSLNTIFEWHSNVRGLILNCFYANSKHPNARLPQPMTQRSTAWCKFSTIKVFLSKWIQTKRFTAFE